VKSRGREVERFTFDVKIMKPDVHRRFPPGVFYALLAAVLFGASTPFSKTLLRQVHPILLAGLLYLGAGSGLTVWRCLRLRLKGTSSEARIKRTDLPWLAGAILAGGIIGPVLLMIGLARTPASTASLLLNLEGVFTALLAWFIFKENFDYRIALGMAAITLGGLCLSWAGKPEVGMPWNALAIAGACLAWGLDNNLTRKVSANDPIQVAAAKGLVAGSVTLTVAVAMGAEIPAVPTVTIAALIGLLSYGISLSLFVLALRHIGTARTGAYFSLAPFVGATLSLVLLGDRVTFPFLVATALMAFGVWLHLTERHEHEHWHAPMIHDHRHRHDEHHQHEHDGYVSAEVSHSHPHAHIGMLHRHPHYPDIHHRH
jgi:drug/metabolite transporter (DMT)-like permease